MFTEPTVTAGVDGSAESLSAADWAAREALRRGLRLRLVHAFDATSPQSGAAHERHALQRAARRLAHDRPALRISTERLPVPVVPALLAAAGRTETLVVGSRGFSGFAGFLVGSVALAVSSCAPCPVVLVRAGELPEDEHLPDADGLPSTRTGYRPVVLGLDLERPGDALIEYAFTTAAARRAPLHVLHTWTVPPLFGYARGVDAAAPDAADLETEKRHALAAALGAWRGKFPETEVTESLAHGRPGHHLLMAATGAGLLVIGRHAPSGQRLGRVAHSVIHHATCPVAVVPHD